MSRRQRWAAEEATARMELAATAEVIRRRQRPVIVIEETGGTARDQRVTHGRPIVYDKKKVLPATVGRRMPLIQAPPKAADVADEREPEAFRIEVDADGEEHVVATDPDASDRVMTMHALLDAIARLCRTETDLRNLRLFANDKVMDEPIDNATRQWWYDFQKKHAPVFANLARVYRDLMTH